MASWAAWKASCPKSNPDNLYYPHKVEANRKLSISTFCNIASSEAADIATHKGPSLWIAPTDPNLARSIRELVKHWGNMLKFVPKNHQLNSVEDVEDVDDQNISKLTCHGLSRCVTVFSDNVSILQLFFCIVTVCHALSRFVTFCQIPTSIHIDIKDLILYHICIGVLAHSITQLELFPGKDSFWLWFPQHPTARRPKSQPEWVYESN